MKSWKTRLTRWHRNTHGHVRPPKIWRFLVRLYTSDFLKYLSCWSACFSVHHCIILLLDTFKYMLQFIHCYNKRVKSDRSVVISHKLLIGILCFQVVHAKLGFCWLQLWWLDFPLKSLSHEKNELLRTVQWFPPFVSKCVWTGADAGREQCTRIYQIKKMFIRSVSVFIGARKYYIYFYTW